MDYAEVFADLQQHPARGWHAVYCRRFSRGGVYLWPDGILEVKEPTAAQKDFRLRLHSMLFEFHVTNCNHARLLARARFQGATAEEDPRWAGWRRAAVEECGATQVMVRGVRKITASVGLWDGGPLAEVDLQTPSGEAASKLRAFLANTPRSLTSFVGQLQAGLGA